MSEDFYDVLGVGRDADEDEIRSAFRKKAAKYHPDVSDEPDAEERFKRVKKAKEVLTDPDARARYDQLGHERYEQAEKRGGFDGGAGGGFGGAGGPFGGGAGGFGDVNDIFEQFFGGGRASSRSRGPRQGGDLQTRLDITLEEAYHGAEKQFSLHRPERCPVCDGAGHPPEADVRTCPNCDGRGQTTTVNRTPFGRVQQTRTCRQCGGEGELYTETCAECGGDGQVRREATLRVSVPAGIRDGQSLRMEGEGAPGEPGAPNGDLLIEVTVEDHPEFDREGDDLRHRHPVSFPQVVFGDRIEVPTLDGAADLKVPAGTQSGRVFRLRGKGMPRLRGRGQGDLYVEVHVVTPDDLNEEQREALEAFAAAGGEEIEVGQGFFERLKNSF